MTTLSKLQQEGREDFKRAGFIGSKGWGNPTRKVMRGEDNEYVDSHYARPEEILEFMDAQIEKAYLSALSDVERGLPKEAKIELEKPRLFQSDPTPNRLGGYSSVPFYCSLCYMSEMDIQDNKLSDGSYHCHCSVWDTPCGGKWVKWFDKNKAIELTEEVPSEENFTNHTLSAVKEVVKKLREKK